MIGREKDLTKEVKRKQEVQEEPNTLKEKKTEETTEEIKEKIEKIMEINSKEVIAGPEGPTDIVLTMIDKSA